MIRLHRLRYVAVVTVLLVAGCSSPAPVAHSPAPEAPQGRTPAAAAPSEALEARPPVRAGDDARTLLAPGGDLSRLASKVLGDVDQLVSLHVEEEYTGERGLGFSYDIDDLGRCSGEGDDAGVHFRFVTTSDGQMLITTDEGAVGQRLDGRWLEAPGYVLAESCPGGPLDTALSTVDGAGSQWLLLDATRVGVERVDGRRAVHFHKSEDGHTADSWIAADGPTTRLLKLVRSDDGGGVHTLRFSQFDTAGPIEPEPAADLVVTPDELSA